MDVKITEPALLYCNLKMEYIWSLKGSFHVKSTIDAIESEKHFRLTPSK